jgi:hypothetical protein
VRRRELLIDLACLALLALAVAALFWPLLLPNSDRWIPRGGGDLVSFIWPMYRFAARSLRSGVVPLWNPHLYSGAPFVADNQSGLFYPINLLTFALIGEPSYAAMEALVAFHIWLAGANMFALTRGLGLRRPAALLGGLSFALSDLFLTHIGNLNLNATAAWLPLLLLLTHRALTSPSTPKSKTYAVAAGAILAVAAMAGHGQMLLFLALTIVLYALYRLAVGWKCGGLYELRTDVGAGTRPAPTLVGWRRQLHTLGLTALIAAVGIGGAALTLLPAYQMAGHTARGHLPYTEATRYSLPPRALIGMLAPGFYGRGPGGFWGPWERVEVGYAGVATLALAALGLTFYVLRFTKPDRFPTLFFIILTPLAFLLAMGRYTPFYRLLYHFAPTFDQVRAPARLILLADLGLAALAAYGLDRLRQRDSGRWHLWIAAGSAVAAGILLTMGLPQAQSVPPPDRVPQATQSVIVAAVLLMLSGLLIALMRRWRRAAWLLPLLLAVDLIGLGSTVEIEPHDPTLGFQHEDVVDFLRQDPALFRIEDNAGAWQPNAALVHGLYDIGGVYNPLELAPYQAYRWAVGERGAPLYNLLGVKYILADKDKPPGDERLMPVYNENPEIDVYLNTLALPRALMVYDVQIVPNHTAAWEAIHAPDFDPTQKVVLEEKQVANSRLVQSPRLKQSSISFVRYGLNEVELKVSTPVSGHLVLSDVYYPGWQATVDEGTTKASEVLRADYAFRAIMLPPGEHTVKMQFRPWTWRVGLSMSLITWTGIALFGILRIKPLRLLRASAQREKRTPIDH